MSHSSLLCQDNFFGCLLKTYCLFCRHDSSVDFTRLQCIIYNLEEGRRAHLFSSNNVQCLFLILMRATLSVDTSSR